jgi:uncharacterized protein YqjF (DUF2071 family)
LRAQVPPQLELDLRDGRAWLAVTPFFLSEMSLRGVPPIPAVSSFPEINVRTYVVKNGIPGVFFFSLDAGKWPAVVGARVAYGLPYFRADIDAAGEGPGVRYRSRRRDGRADFVARYRPTSPVRHPQPGSLEYFLVERYCLYAIRAGRVWRAHIHHEPWPLQDASAEIERNTMAEAAGIHLPPEPPLLHYAERIEVLTWGLESAGR